MNDDFFSEFDAMFADLARKARPGGFEPNADVFLTSDGTTLVVNVEIAGADPAELRVMVEDRRLYIVGRRYDRERAARGSVLMKEIEYGDGILTIRLPVSEHSLLPRNRTEIRMIVKRTPA